MFIAIAGATSEQRAEVPLDEVLLLGRKEFWI
jgi:hypothetical protein